MRGLGCSEHSVVFLPSPSGRRVGDEGLLEHLYLLFVLRGWRVAFTDKISIGVAAAVSPHPALSQWRGR
jgi:hypothetical protein